MTCVVCGLETVPYTRRKYCSMQCQRRAQYVRSRDLKQRVGSAVAGLAERHQVGKLVGGEVVGEQAEGADVVNVGAWLAALLTRSVIAPTRLALLRHPVGAAVIGALGTDVLGMEDADSVAIPARPRAVFPLPPSAAGVTRRQRESGSATNAGQRDDVLWPGSDSGVLTGGRTGTAPPVLEPRGDDAERLSAVLAGDFCGAFHPTILPGGTQVGRRNG